MSQPTVNVPEKAILTGEEELRVVAGLSGDLGVGEARRLLLHAAAAKAYAVGLRDGAKEQLLAVGLDGLARFIFAVPPARPAPLGWLEYSERLARFLLERIFFLNEEAGNAAYRASVARGIELLAAERDALKEALEGVHHRLVVDHFTGTSEKSPRFWSCRICGWRWSDGEAELHEPTCPLATAAMEPSAWYVAEHEVGEPVLQAQGRLMQEVP